MKQLRARGVETVVVMEDPDFAHPRHHRRRDHHRDGACHRLASEELIMTPRHASLVVHHPSSPALCAPRRAWSVPGQGLFVIGLTGYLTGKLEGYEK